MGLLKWFRKSDADEQRLAREQCVRDRERERELEDARERLRRINDEIAIYSRGHQ